MTTETSTYRFRAVADGYTVERRDAAPGLYLGKVVQRTERSNFTTTRSWIALRLDGRTIKDGGGQVAAKFKTRIQAAMALDTQGSSR